MGLPSLFCVCKKRGSMDGVELWETETGLIEIPDFESELNLASVNGGNGSSELDIESGSVQEPTLELCEDRDSADFNFPLHREVVGRLSDSLVANKPKYIWEDGFLGAVFGNKRSATEFCTNISLPALKRPVTSNVFIQKLDVTLHSSESSNSKPKTSKHLYLKALKRTSVKDDAGKRKSVVEGWTSVICLALEAFKVGRDMIARRRAFNRVDLVAALDDCMATKSTSTITKRLGSINRFVNFCLSNGRQVFPLTGDALIEYLRSLTKDEKAYASTGTSFIEALHFAGGVFGLNLDGLDAVNAQANGIARRMASDGEPLGQAGPLTVSQIKRLEELVAVSESDADRVLFGGMVFMAYSCARVSDVARGVSMIVDLGVADDPMIGTFEPYGYIELSVVGNKGARSIKHKRSILPVVAPLVSLSGHKWWESWLIARDRLGLENEGKLQLPLIPRFDPGGAPVPQAVMATELGEMLRLGLGVETKSRNLVRSHSLKTTVLSWLAKFGVPLPFRRTMGHHLDPAAQSAEIYARDAIAPALREAVKVLHHIQRGTFVPDNTRSGRFVTLNKPTDVLDENEEDDQSGVSSDTLDGDTSTSDSSSDRDEGAAEDIPDSRSLLDLVTHELQPRSLELSDDYRMWRHRESGTQHLQWQDAAKFLCGRLIGDRYRLTPDRPSLECPGCKVCFSNKGIEDVASEFWSQEE